MEPVMTARFLGRRNFNRQRVVVQTVYYPLSAAAQLHRRSGATRAGTINDFDALDYLGAGYGHESCLWMEVPG
jgi:hypothetical protein